MFIFFGQAVSFIRSCFFFFNNCSSYTSYVSGSGDLPVNWSKSSHSRTIESRRWYWPEADSCNRGCTRSVQGVSKPWGIWFLRVYLAGSWQVTHFLGKMWSADTPHRGSNRSPGPNRECDKKGILCGSAWLEPSGVRRAVAQSWRDARVTEWGLWILSTGNMELWKVLNSRKTSSDFQFRKLTLTADWRR